MVQAIQLCPIIRFMGAADELLVNFGFPQGYVFLLLFFPTGVCLGIRSMVKMADNIPDKIQQKSLEQKLEKCRNPENNPDTEL